jgi:hypothetical protein
VLGGGEINTDERPLIEYRSPTAQWNREAGGSPWFVSTRLARFVERLQTAVPADRDPYLASLTPAERRYVESGAHYYRAVVERLRGNDDAAYVELGGALERLPASVQVGGPFMALDRLVQ